MLYTFFAGIRIQSTSAYSALTEAERTEARTTLFDAIRPVVDGMGQFETDDPNRYLEGILAAAQGGPWAMGSTFVDGIWYYISPVNGEVICVRDHDLRRAGTPYSVTITVGGREITAGFYTRQSAVNPT